MIYREICLIFIIASSCAIGAYDVSTPSIINGTIKLEKPGEYNLITPLKIVERNDDVPLIEIVQSDIVLDFHNYTIVGSLEKNNNIGIKIAPNLSNIVIKNGTVKNCSGKALELGGSCFNITIKSFSFQNMLSPSISIDNGGSIFFEDIDISGIRSDTEVANYVVGEFNTVAFYMYESVHNIENGCSIKNMKIDHLLRNGDDRKCAVMVAQGIEKLFMDNVYMTNFMGTQVFGVYLDHVRTCRGINLTIEQMDAVNNSTAHLVGVRFCSCEDCLLQDSLIYGNRSDNSLIGVEWVGDGFAADLKNITIEGTRISQNYGQHVLYGIKGKGGKHNLIKNCNILANRNQIVEIIPTDFAIGIDISEFEEVSQISNSEISLQWSMGVACGITLGFESEYGFYPLMTVVDNNKLYNNVGVAGSYGFRDYSPAEGFYPCATILTNNISSGHGPVFKIGSSEVMADEPFMNYFSYDIKENPAGIVNEVLSGALNASVHSVNSPLNDSYVNLEIYKWVSKTTNRVDFIRRHAGGNKR